MVPFSLMYKRSRTTWLCSINIFWKEKCQLLQEQHTFKFCVKQVIYCTTVWHGKAKADRSETPSVPLMLGQPLPNLKCEMLHNGSEEAHAVLHVSSKVKKKPDTVEIVTLLDGSEMDLYFGCLPVNLWWWFIFAQGTQTTKRRDAIESTAGMAAKLPRLWILIPSQTQVLKLYTLNVPFTKSASLGLTLQCRD